MDVITCWFYYSLVDGEPERGNVVEVENPADLTARGQRKLEMLGRTDLLDSARECKKRLPSVIIIGK